VLIALIIAGVAGAGYQTAASDRALKRYPPPGGLFDVGGYKLHIDCVGQGPTVVLESGLGGWSIDWAGVQDEISRFARVCSYDRAGMGWSDRAPARAVSRAGTARALRTLLRKAGLPGPFILVGHSIGGIYTREFVARYPGEVAGLVFVDSSHEEMGSRMPKAERRSQTRRLMALRFFRFLTPFGAQFVTRTAAANTSEVAASVRREARAIGYRSQGYFAMYDEASSLLREDERGTLRLRPIPPVPVVVLTADENLKGKNGRVWAALQAELASLSPAGRQQVAQGSGHFIQHDRLDLVVAAVREVVSARSDSSEPNRLDLDGGGPPPRAPGAEAAG
jgi:pimeloyl-ACP methyl ester carboxylesterase